MDVAVQPLATFVVVSVARVEGASAEVSAVQAADMVAAEEITVAEDSVAQAEHTVAHPATAEEEEEAMAVAATAIRAAARRLLVVGRCPLVFAPNSPDRQPTFFTILFPTTHGYLEFGIDFLIFFRTAQ